MCDMTHPRLDRTHETTRHASSWGVDVWQVSHVAHKMSHPISNAIRVNNNHPKKNKNQDESKIDGQDRASYVVTNEDCGCVLKVLLISLSHVMHVGVMWHMWRRCMLSRMKIVIVFWRRASYAWVVSHMSESLRTCRWAMPLMWMSHVAHVDASCHIQPIADRMAQHLEIISKTFPTNQNSAHGIYD